MRLNIHHGEARLPKSPELPKLVIEKTAATGNAFALTRGRCFEGAQLLLCRKIYEQVGL